jgi:signal transduction histidine kinase
MKPRTNRRNLLLYPAVLGYIAVFVTGILDLNATLRPIAALLLALFGIVYFLLDIKTASRWFTYTRTGIETLLVAGLLILKPGWGVFPILFFLISPALMADYPFRIGLYWLTSFSLVTAIIFFVEEGLIGLVAMLPFVAGYFFFAIFGWTTVQAEKERCRSEQLLSELQQAHQQLQEYTSRVEELTIAQERNRIAREMHDTLGHRLTIAAVQLEGAQRLVYTDPERTDRILGTVREQVRDGLGELRRTVAMLRASVEEDMPIQEALVKLASQVQEATGLNIHLTIEDCPTNLPAAYRLGLYRAAQECLTNIQRHAKASEAWLHLEERERKITLLVSDNGVGISPEQMKAGLGLSGLGERATILGGDLFIDPRPCGGTQITFRFPIPEEKIVG